MSEIKAVQSPLGALDAKRKTPGYSLFITVLTNRLTKISSSASSISLMPGGVRVLSHWTKPRQLAPALVVGVPDKFWYIVVLVVVTSGLLDSLGSRTVSVLKKNSSNASSGVDSSSIALTREEITISPACCKIKNQVTVNVCWPDMTVGSLQATNRPVSVCSVGDILSG